MVDPCRARVRERKLAAYSVDEFHNAVGKYVWSARY